MITTTIKDENRTPDPASTISIQTARVAVFLPALFILLLVLLHILKPEVDPSWQPISVYGLGRHAFLMAIAFLSMGGACVALFMTLRSQTRITAGKIGFAFLLLCATGFFIGGIFPTDPVHAETSAPTLSGHLHNLGASLGGLLPFALLFLTIALLKNENWKKERKALWTITLMAWATDIAFTATMAAHHGKFGPGAPVGWYNRLMIVTYAASVLWMAVIAIRIRRSRTN